MPATTTPSTNSRSTEGRGAACPHRRHSSTRLLRTTGSALEVVISFGIFAVGVLTTYEVAGRKLFAGLAALGSTLNWVEELSTYIIGWVIMVFIVIAVFRDEHIAASVIPARLLRVRGVASALSILRSAAFVLAGLVLLYYGWHYVVQDWEGDARSISSLRAPFWIVHLCLPLAGALMTVGGLGRLAQTLISIGRERSRVDGS